MLTTVVNTIRPTASSTAFLAPPGVLTTPTSEGPPTNWKRSEICGRITWYATATAPMVTTEPTSMIQPAIHEVNGRAICLDHWYTEPASGNCPASSAKHSATRNCPASTVGQ